MRKFISVKLGWSKSGEELTSAVLVPTQDKPAKKQEALSGNEKLGLRAYEQAVRDNSDAFRGEGPILLSAALWRKHFDLNSSSDKPDSRRKAFNRMLSGLLEKHCIIQPKQGFYRLAGNQLELEQRLQQECCGTTGQDGTSADNVPGK